MMVRMEMWMFLVTLCLLQDQTKGKIFLQTVTLHLSKQTVLEHSKVTLTCAFTGFRDEQTISSWKIANVSSFVSLYGYICAGLTPLNNRTLYQVRCLPANTFSVTILNVMRQNHNTVWQCGSADGKYKSKGVPLNVTVPVEKVSLVGINKVKENATALFHCSTSFSLPPPHISWFKKNNVTLTEIKSSSFAIITHSERKNSSNLVKETETLQYTVDRSINGWSVYCNASNWVKNQVQSNIMTLNILYPPDGPPVIKDFTNGSTYKVIETKLASLSCSVEGGNPLGNLTLFCRDIIYNTSTVISINHRKVTTFLSWKADRNHGRTCICRTNHVLSTDLALVNIDVLYPPGFPTIQLQFGNYKKNLTLGAKLIENKSYLFSCSAIGNPLPSTYIWMGPQEMQMSMNNSIYLPKVQRTQNGIYSCHAQNIMKPTNEEDTMKESNNSINVDILYEPVIVLLDSQNVVEGSSLNITCNAESANPNKTDVIWTRDKHDWNKTSHDLKLQNISRYDSMSYTCTMKNYMTPTVGPKEEGFDSETFYLNVWYKAVVKEFVVKGHEKENPVIANQSTWIQFTCEMDSNPNSTGSINLPNGTTLGVTNTSYLLSSCLDSGNYSCSGSNEYNYGQQASADINLLVNCKPMSKYRVKEDIRSKLYVPVTLQFTAIAYPDPEFTWEMLTKSSWEEVTNDDMISISSLGMHANLTVNNFTSTKVIYFRLIIKNFMGDLTQNYTLQPFAAVETTEDAIGGLVAGSISGAIAFAGLVVFGILLYWKRQTGKKGGNNESTRSHEGVSQMKTMAEEHIPYTTGLVYEDLRQNRDRGLIEIMENTYQQLRREKGTTSEEMETEIEEVKEENDGVGSSNPIYTNLKLDVV